MEGDGPLFGTAVSHGLLAVSSDPVSADATCARLMGCELEEVGHLALATSTGVGQPDKIEVRGTNMTALRRKYFRSPTA